MMINNWTKNNQSTIFEWYPVKGICGTHREKWQVGNHQWHGGTTGYDNDVFLSFLQWMSLKYIWLMVFGSIIDHHNGTTCNFCRPILGIFIFHSTFLEVKKQEDFSGLSTSPVTWSTSTCSKLWEVWELPLSVPFVFVALPLGGSNGMDYYGLCEGLPSPWWGYGKQPMFPTCHLPSCGSHRCF